MRRSLVLAVLVACGPTPMGEMGNPGEAGPMGTMGTQGPPGPGSMVKEVTSTGQLVVGASTTTFTLIPGLATTVAVPAGTVLNVRTDGGMQCTGTGNAFSAIDVAIFIDGLETTAARRVVAANTVGVAQIITNWSFGRTFVVTPGAHTIEVRAVSAGGGGVDANVSSGSAPQLQGVLAATLLQPIP